MAAIWWRHAVLIRLLVLTVRLRERALIQIATTAVMIIGLATLWNVAGWITAALHSSQVARPSLAKYGALVIYAVAALAAFLFLAVFSTQMLSSFGAGTVCLLYTSDAADE